MQFWPWVIVIVLVLFRPVLHCVLFRLKYAGWFVKKDSGVRYQQSLRKESHASSAGSETQL